MPFPMMGSLPGQQAKTENYEAVMEWGGARSPRQSAPVGMIYSTTVDAGSTPTSVLRAGLLMGYASSSTKAGFYTQWDPAATDGSQDIVGYLSESVSMLGISGAVENKMAPDIICAGYVKASGLTILGTAFSSHASAALARAFMTKNGRFMFDDDVQNVRGMQPVWGREVPKTANYTITAADSGTLFTNTGAGGAVVLTLPAIAPGLRFGLRVIANQNLGFTKADGNVVALNNATATSVTFQTTNEKIGGGMTIESNQAGTLWLVTNNSPGANTITVA